MGSSFNFVPSCNWVKEFGASIFIFPFCVALGHLDRMNTILAFKEGQIHDDSISRAVVL